MSEDNPYKDLSDDKVVDLANTAGRGVYRGARPQAAIVEMIRRHKNSLVKANAVQTWLAISVVALTVAIIALMFVQIAVAVNRASWPAAAATGVSDRCPLLGTRRDRMDGKMARMSDWWSLIKHLTKEQAWQYVHDDETLDSLSEKAQEELAGLDAFGRSGNPPEMLYRDVQPFTMARFPPQWNPKHVRSALMRLGITEP